jgi:hypothetical protein
VTTKHSAPAQYLGFGLQPVRLCYHLLTCGHGDQISLEHLDDVAIHRPDGSVVLEQCKSALKQNPIADWAPDLWKTVANWLDAVTNGQVVADKAEFRLYVTPIRTGAHAQALDRARTPLEVKALTVAIQTALKKLRRPRACMPHLLRFFGATDDDRVAVVTRMKVISTDEDPMGRLREQLELTIPPALVNNICEAAIGMAKQQAEHLIRRGEPAILDADRFRSAFRAFVQKNNLPGLLASFSTRPNPAEVNSLFTSRPVFIRQLELIEVSSGEQIRAVSDFLRTSADKSIWAEKGLIFEQSFQDWDDGLIRRHTAIAGEISDLYPDQLPKVRGRLAYRRCAVIEAPLDGRAVPLHFVHGCFNALADNRRLGWHPEYETLLEMDDT